MRRSRSWLILIATIGALSGTAHASSNLKVTITGGPSGTVNSTSATFTFSANESASFTCQLDGGTATACSSPQTYDALGDGSHTFTVTATQPAGAGPPNTSSDSRTWTIDTSGAPPAIPTGPRGDVDGDGLAGTSDFCPLTPAHARAIAHGCAAIEIVGSPQLFTAPSLGSLGRMTKWFHTRNPAFKRFAKNTRNAGKRILQAQLQVSNGAVCRASKSFTGGLKLLRTAAASLPRVEKPLKTLLRRKQGNTDANGGFEGLAIGGGFAKFAVGDASVGATAFHKTCNAVAKHRLHVHGRVSSVDSAHGRVAIGGVPFLLGQHPKGQPPFAGGNANAVGIAFKDGTGIIASNKENGAVAITGPPAQIKCEVLRIAPIQTFDAPVPHTIVLQDPLGYQTGGKLRLEQGMRLGAHDKCGGSGGGISPGASFTRRSLRLVLDFKNAATNLQATTTIASDQTELDAPASFPANVDNFTDATLTVHEQSQTCQLAVGSLACGKPAEVGSPQTYKLRLQPRGSYATAHYDTTDFNLEGKPYGTFSPAHVSSVTTSPSLGGTNAAFHALGYPISNANSSRPNEGDVFQGTAFAVYLDDFFAPDDVFAFDMTGVDHPAGIKWPRVEGTRGGHPFWYLAKVPVLKKDFLGACNAPDPNAYFKLPWTPDLPGWKLFNGNFDDPSGHGHPDTGKNYGNNQKWAYDFAFDSNNNGIGESFLDIRAARDGKVIALQDGENGNSYKTGTTEEDQSWTAPHPKGYTGVGNFIVIEIADGRFTSYWHLKKGGFHVKVGDQVTRGQLIATSDNTGNSTTPHMHFDARSGWDLGYPPSGIEFPSTRLTFEDKNHACWRPLVGDPLASDNSGG